jgi:hypothetical protein
MHGPERIQNGPVLVLAPFGRDASVICAMLREAGIEACEQSNLPENAIVGRVVLGRRTPRGWVGPTG